MLIRLLLPETELKYYMRQHSVRTGFGGSLLAGNLVKAGHFVEDEGSAIDIGQFGIPIRNIATLSSTLDVFHHMCLMSMADPCPCLHSVVLPGSPPAQHLVECHQIGESAEAKGNQPLLRAIE